MIEWLCDFLLTLVKMPWLRFPPFILHRDGVAVISSEEDPRKFEPRKTCHTEHTVHFVGFIFYLVYSTFRPPVKRSKAYKLNAT